MFKRSSLHMILTNCTLNGTTHSKKNTKVIQYVTKNSWVAINARPVVLQLQSGAIFTYKVK